MIIGSSDANRVIPAYTHEDSRPTCNDAKAEQPAVWTTNMETDHERQEKRSSWLKSQTAIDTDNDIEGSKQSDEPLICLHASSQEPMMNNLVAELQIRSPILRTMSEGTVYFDAANDWESEISAPATVIETDHNSSISSHIPQQQMIEERLPLFNQKAFIPNQLESIYADLNKQDILLVMPSGPARDMCYLLPSTLQKPSSHLITIVIVASYASLQEKDANPSYNSDHVQSAFVSRFRVSKRHWISPSRFRRTILDTTLLRKSTIFLLTFDGFSRYRSEIQHLHQCNRLARIVLEDAHCFSQWGTDFHFGYLKIAEKLRGMYANTPITALTAISNERVLADIMNSLHMPESTTRVFKRSILL
ncbi:hypothetical protein V8B55DRAFT_1479966 [Mucor lusitanicus]